MRLQNLTPELAKALNVPQTTGALINEVTKNSPGDKAGLKSDDVVVSLDGKKVDSNSALSRQVALRPPGSAVTLGVYRGGKAQDVKVTLTSRPGELDKLGDARGPRPGSSHKDETNRQRIGLTLQSIDPRTAEASGLPTRGAVITEVQPGSPADAAELAPGMVVTEAGGEEDRLRRQSLQAPQGREAGHHHPAPGDHPSAQPRGEQLAPRPGRPGVVGPATRSRVSSLR